MKTLIILSDSSVSSVRSVVNHFPCGFASMRPHGRDVHATFVTRRSRLLCVLSALRGESFGLWFRGCALLSCTLRGEAFSRALDQEHLHLHAAHAEARLCGATAARAFGFLG